MDLNSALRISASGLSAERFRMDVISANIANANTPLYRSQQVDFEGALADALRAGRPAPSLQPTTTGGLDLVDNAGTSVSLENELTGIAKTSLERQVMVSGFNYKMDLLKSAAGTK